MSTELAEAPLGKPTQYVFEHNPSLLFAIPRAGKREEVGITKNLPFQGFDIWNAYELSWLNSKGKPCVAIGAFTFPVASPNIIESKSFKLYLNSFNNTRFPSLEAVEATLASDLSQACGLPVTIQLEPLGIAADPALGGTLLDTLDISCDTYLVEPNFLAADFEAHVEETLASHLLKSNCLITNQPDWASIQIHYSGPKIDHAGLLRYIVSFRNHNEFHEQCIERIFTDIQRICKPESLTIRAWYTRRGGLDICPCRSTEAIPPRLPRLKRQ